MSYHQQQQPTFFSPSNFSHMPNSEVNWAQLAQRWIHSQQQQEPLPQSQQQYHQNASYPPPPPPAPSSGPPLPAAAGGYPPQQYPNYQQPPTSQQPYIPPLFPSTEHRPPHGAGYFQQASMARYPEHHTPNKWGPRPPPWIPSPQQKLAYPPRYPPSGMAGSAPSSAGQIPSAHQYPMPAHQMADKQEEEEYQAHYDPSLEEQDAGDVGQAGGEQQPYADDPNAPPEGAMAHWMVDTMWAGAYAQNYMPIIDMQMRKKLPSWILEGLEKAEKEKQKKLVKEEMERRRKELEEEKQKKREQKGLGKFDSDSDDEEEDETGENGDEKRLKEKRAKGKPSVPRHFREFLDEEGGEREEEEDERTEEQRREEAVQLMRRLITTVLLDVTNREFERIAGESIMANIKSKASQPKILAKSSALAMLSSLGDDDDDEEEEEEEEASNNDRAETTMAMAKKEPTGKIAAVKSEPLDSDVDAAAASGTGGGSVVFKVPSAPLQKSVGTIKKEPKLEPVDETEHQKPDEKKAEKEGRDHHGNDSRDKERHRRDSDREKRRYRDSKNDGSSGESRRVTPPRNTKEDDRLPTRYRSNDNGKGEKEHRERGDRDKERDHRDNREQRTRSYRDAESSRDRDRERDRDRDRDHGKERNRQRSRSRSRSPKRRRGSFHRDRSRSPVRR